MINPSASIQQLIGAYQHGHYDTVVQVISAQPALLNQNPVVVQIYAGSLRRVGEADKAKSALLRGLKRFKKNPDLLNSLGNLYLEAGRVPDAVASLKLANSLSPGNTDIQYNLARALKDNGEAVTAKKILSDLITRQPTNHNARIILADIAISQKQTQQAKHYLNEALSIQPGNVSCMNNLANIHRSEGDLDNAQALLEKALSLQPDNSVLLRNLAACQVLAQHKPDARQSFQRAIAANPDDWKAQEEFASFMWAEGDDAPFLHIEQHLGEPATRLPFWLAYINLLIQVEDFQRAHDLLVELEAHHKNAPEVLTTKSRILREMGSFDKALLAAQTTLKTDSKSRMAMSEAGYSLLSLGRPGEALAYFAKLSRLDPENQGWWTMLSSCWSMLNKNHQYRWLCQYDDLISLQPLLKDESARADLNGRLKDYLLTLHQNQRHPIGQSLRNGTQTYEDLFDHETPIISQLGEAILASARQFISTCQKDKSHPFLSRLSQDLSFIGSWSVRLRSGGFHKSHYHPEGWLSGVYYVDVPEEVNLKGQGWLVFGRANIPQQPFEGDYAVKPEAGHVVLFPSFMWHGTNAFESDTHRMTVAFDIVPSNRSK